MNLAKYNHIHCLGIGGIGVSAIARIMHELGRPLSGSDVQDTLITMDLRAKGIKLVIGRHKPSNIPANTDLVIYSNAIEKNNLELAAARKRHITCYSYPEFLGLLMDTSKPIVISGTHGKSTTTAMVAKIFFEAKLDPWVVVGSLLPELRSNAHVGLGKYFIVEGDEYREAFLNYNPCGLIINNIEPDHLDYYKTFKRIQNAFEKLAHRVPAGGIIIANADDPTVQKVIAHARSRIITFGYHSEHYQLTHVVQHGELTRFSVRGLERFDIALRVPGLYNVFNALAATVLALSFGIPLVTIQRALLDYSGIWRRFEIKGERRGITIIDDYAHHPTEIRAVLKAARTSFPKKKIWCIFQPHSRHRTQALFNDFVTAFDDCDVLIIPPIYDVAGRDKKEKISSQIVVKAIQQHRQNVYYLPTFNQIINKIKKDARPGDVIVTVGAGTITQLSNQLVDSL